MLRKIAVSVASGALLLTTLTLSAPAAMAASVDGLPEWAKQNLLYGGDPTYETLVPSIEAENPFMLKATDKDIDVEDKAARQVIKGFPAGMEGCNLNVDNAFLVVPTADGKGKHFYFSGAKTLKVKNGVVDYRSLTWVTNFDIEGPQGAPRGPIPAYMEFMADSGCKDPGYNQRLVVTGPAVLRIKGNSSLVGQNPTPPNISGIRPVVDGFYAYDRVYRAGGNNRYETAVEVASIFPNQVDSVYLATGTTYPDALAAASVAGQKASPVLLLETNRLTASVSAELRRMNPRNIVIMGGPGAVSKAVENQIRHAAPSGSTVSRASGSDRYATAADLAKRTFPSGSGAVFLASGQNFPDALVAASAAAQKDAALLLVAPNAVPSATKRALQDLNPSEIFIIGGEGAVGKNVETTARTYGRVTRVGGNNRFETSRAVALRFFQANPPLAVVANGMDFPDALVGGALAGAGNGPVLLTQARKLPNETRAVLQQLKPQGIVASGGHAVITRKTIREIGGVVGLKYLSSTTPEPEVILDGWFCGPIDTQRYRKSKGWNYDEALKDVKKYNCSSITEPYWRADD